MNRHGEVLLSWEGNILIIRAKGAFNEEGVQHAIDAIKETVSASKLDIWHRLGIWDEEALGSPSTLTLVKEIHEWCIDKGCNRIAIVLCNSVQQTVAENMFGDKVHIFRDEGDAKQWLLS